jgi:proteic killer suppression protein
MEIYFKNTRLRKQLTNEKAMVAKHGPKRASLLQQRLSEIEASANLDVLSRLPGPRFHPLTKDRRGQLSVDLDHPYRLLLVPEHDPVPELPSGGMDLRAITKVVIIEITDTHE